MKRLFAVIGFMLIFIGVAACKKNERPLVTTDSSTVSGVSQSVTSETPTTKINDAITVKTTTGPVTTNPITTKPNSNTIVTGVNNHNSGTHTGYASLPTVTFTVIDPENTRKLSTTAIGYSYGISKNAIPPQSSVDAQKKFDNYGAFGIDRKHSEEKKLLYLTFDCGYEYNNLTAKFLDILKEKKVPAAFFVTQDYLRTAPEIAARMIKEGHIVGNHSATHPNFTKINRTKMAKDIESCENYLRTHFGYSSPYFRFPAGEYSDNALDLVQSIGFTSVFWSVAHKDWEVNNQPGKQAAFNTLTSRLHPGAVILLHSVSQSNLDAMADIIDWARAQGYTFVSLEEYKKS